MRTLGGYALFARLASGSLGDVFLARSERGAGGPCVVKDIQSGLTQDLGFVRLLMAEATAAREFTHPRVPTILDVDRDAGHLFVAMDVVQGQSLSAVLKTCRLEGVPLDHATIAWIGAEVASILHAAHDVSWNRGRESRMVHGALSPRSVFVTYEGQVCVLGLGVGRARSRVEPSAARLPFIAPELLSGREISPRTDVYGLGTLLHAAFTDRPVYRRSNPQATRTAIREANAPPLGIRQLNLDPAIGELIAQMMAPRVEARPKDLSMIEERLRAVAKGSDAEFSAVLRSLMERNFQADRDAFDRQVEASLRASGSQVPSAVSSRPTPGPLSTPAAPLEPSAPEPADSPNEDLAAKTSVSETPVSEPQALAAVEIPVAADETPSLAESSVAPEPSSASEASSLEGEESGGLVSPKVPNPLPRGVSELNISISVNEPIVRSESALTAEATRLVEPDRPPNSVEAPSASEAPAASASSEASSKDALPRSESDFDVSISVNELPLPPELASTDSAPATSAPPDVGTDSEEVPQAVIPASAEPPAPEMLEASSSGSALPAKESPVPDRPRTTEEWMLRWAAQVPSDVAAHETFPGAESAAAGETPRADLPPFPGPSGQPQQEWSMDIDSSRSGRVDAVAQPRIGRYHVFKILAEDVEVLCLGRDPNCDRDVWLEVLDPKTISDPRLDVDEWVLWFKRRARLLGGLLIDGLPIMLDAGRQRGAYFIVRSPCPGDTLDEVLLQNGTMSSTAVTGMLADLAKALDGLHSGGLLHGGLSPKAVRIDENGRARIADLSSVFSIDGPQHPLLVRRIHALTPEYLAGQGYGAASDQFLLGIIGIMALTGKDPFPADEEARIAALQNLKPLELPEAEERLRNVLARLLASRPEDRFERMKDVAQALSESGMPMAPEPAAAQRADAELLVVDPDLEAVHTVSLLSERGIKAAVFGKAEDAFQHFEHGAARRLVVARGDGVDETALRRRLKNLGTSVELTMIPSLAQRLQGSAIPLDRAVAGWCHLAERASGLRSSTDAPSWGTLADGLAGRLGARPDQRYLAAILASAAELADRCEMSAQDVAKVPWVPAPAVAPLQEVLNPSGESTETSRTVSVQAASVVRAFAAAVRNGTEVQAPSVGLAALRQQVETQWSTEAVDAMEEELRSRYGTQDLILPAPGTQRVVVARRIPTVGLVEALMMAGFVVTEAKDGHEAWDLLRADMPAVAIVDRTLPGRDGIALLELCRAHPRLDRVVFLVMVKELEEDASLRVERAGRAHILEDSATPESIVSWIDKLSV